MARYLEDALLALLNEQFSQVQLPAEAANMLEKQCDRIKEVIATKLFREKTTFQFTKSDRYNIVLKVDDVINQADIIAHKIQLYELKIPSLLIPSLKELVKFTCQAIKDLQITIMELRQNFTKAIDKAAIVEDDRRTARHICWDLLKTLYHIPSDPITLLLTRELILDLMTLADKAERLSDFIELLAIRYARIK